MSLRLLPRRCAWRDRQTVWRRPSNILSNANFAPRGYCCRVTQDLRTILQCQSPIGPRHPVVRTSIACSAIFTYRPAEPPSRCDHAGPAGVSDRSFSGMEGRSPRRIGRRRGLFEIRLPRISASSFPLPLSRRKAGSGAGSLFRIHCGSFPAPPRQKGGCVKRVAVAVVLISRRGFAWCCSSTASFLVVRQASEVGSR